MEIYDILLQRGATFRRVLRFRRNGEAVDLTGYEAKCQVREHPNGGKLLCEVECVVSPSAGRVDLLIPASVSAGFEPGVYAWDLRVTSSDGVTSYYLGGKFRVAPSVTE